MTTIEEFRASRRPATYNEMIAGGYAWPQNSSRANEDLCGFIYLDMLIIEDTCTWDRTRPEEAYYLLLPDHSDEILSSDLAALEQRLYDYATKEAMTKSMLIPPAGKRHFNEHPGIPIPEFALDWDDQSWHNDTCGKIYKPLTASAYPTLRLWVEFDDPAEREYPEGPKYVLELLTHEDQECSGTSHAIYTGEDVDACQAAIQAAIEAAQ